MTLLAIVLLPFLGAFLPAWFVRWGRTPSALAAGAVTAACLALLASLAPVVMAGETAVASWSWVPSLGLDFSLMADGLGWLFALLILGVGLLVVVYARFYLEASDPPGRFYGFLLLFMGSMLGIVLSRNLILMLVFWELTSVSSFLLIGYWKHLADSREGARMALVVTGAGGLALLGGFLLLGSIVGSYDLGDVLSSGDAIRASPRYLPALALILLGVFTKSAQFPFHFWLPHAMAAPTPVSAYLHSATMVKAGIFLLARLHPALSGTSAWFVIVTGAGMTTLVLGAYFAFLKDDLKSLLAFSTISHLGLITALFGFGTPEAAFAAVFHVVNHAAFKASLFMTAGIVEHETGTRDLTRLGGLRRAMPVTAALAVAAAAAMAGIPPLNGFVSKEMFFEASLHLDAIPWAPWIVPLLAFVAGALGVAYSLRFVGEVFFGPPGAKLDVKPHEPPRGMRGPVELLVAVCLLAGLFPGVVAEPLVRVATQATLGGPAPESHLALWHGFNLPLLMSVGAVLLGVGVWWARGTVFRLNEGPLRVPEAKSMFERAVLGTSAAAHAFTAQLENGSLQRYLALFVLVVLAAAGIPLLLDPPAPGTAPLTPVGPVDAVGWIVLVVGALGVVALHRRRAGAIVLLSVVGLIVSLAFVHFSAPDLALTQISVEVVTIVLLLLALHLLPRTSAPESTAFRRGRDAVLATAAGGVIAALTWLMLTRPLATISDFHLAESKPGGGGYNVVNVILVDFRGFDTFGEISVLAIAALGIYALVDGLGLPTRWSPAALDDEVRHPLMLVVVARLLLPLALLVGVYVFLRGHNLPGGGFIAGLIVSVALVLQYIATGMGWTQDRVRRDFHPLIGVGVLVAGLTGLGSWLFGEPFLTSWYDHFELPVIGEFELASAMAFDLGVFLTVVGVVLMVLVNMGKAPGADRTREHPLDPAGG